MPAVGFFEAQSSIATEHGDVYIRETGAGDGSNGNFTLLRTIVGGTGRYADATGQLFAHGKFDFVTGHGQGEYEGTIWTR